MACFVVINVSQGSVATYARCGGIFRIFSIYLTTNLRRNLPVEIFLNLFVFDRIVVMSLWPHFFGPPFSSCDERHYPLGHAANRTERERDGFSRLEAWTQLSCGSLFFFFFLYYAIHGSTPAHKHRLLTTENTWYIKTTSKIQKSKYKSKSAELRTLSHPTRNRATAAGPEHNTDTPHASGVNASSRLGGTSLVSRLSACLTEANWWRLIAE